MSRVSRSVERARRKWQYQGRGRPPFATAPRRGQESVWDYPRPPRVEADRRRIEVFAEGWKLADTRSALRVLETASPPTYYLPPSDVHTDLLEPMSSRTLCEWKGRASYYAAILEDVRIERAAWRYLDPYPEYQTLAGYVGFYPWALDCRVDGERVQPQPGGFYGGWITSELVGPFKGPPGTESW